jgi:hypothetical protein
MTNGAAATAASLVMIGLAALVSAFAMPAHRPAAPDLRLDLHLLRPLGAMLDLVKGDRIIRLAIFGKALFWLAGTLLLAEIPAMTRDVLGGAPEVVALLFALFSVGLSLGMIGCSRFGGRDGAIRHVWIAGLLVSLFLADMCVASMHVAPTADLLTLSAFVADPGRLRIVADLGALAILAGVFVVPLGVSLQTRPAPEARARIVSIDNAVSSLVMVAGMAAASLAIALDVGLIEIFFGFAALNALACLYLRSALRRPALAV